MGTGGQSKVTPNSKKRVQGPLSVVLVACVLAAIPATERDLEATYEAAFPLLGPSIPKETILKALGEAIQAILTANEVGGGSSSDWNPRKLQNAPFKTTAQLVEDLHKQLFTQDIDSMQSIHLHICLRLLEVQCLSNGGAQCSSVLRRGGMLAAAACIAAAFCIVSPPDDAARVGPGLLSSLETLTGFPREVLLTQAQTLLKRAIE